jgi:hypothetical protein
MDESPESRQFLYLNLGRDQQREPVLTCSTRGRNPKICFAAYPSSLATVKGKPYSPGQLRGKRADLGPTGRSWPCPKS